MQAGKSAEEGRAEQEAGRQTYSAVLVGREVRTWQNRQ
jgi:hypothetical protein